MCSASLWRCRRCRGSSRRRGGHARDVVGVVAGLAEDVAERGRRAGRFAHEPDAGGVEAYYRTAIRRLGASPPWRGGRTGHRRLHLGPHPVGHLALGVATSHVSWAYSDRMPALLARPPCGPPSPCPRWHGTSSRRRSRDGQHGGAHQGVASPVHRRRPACAVSPRRRHACRAWHSRRSRYPREPPRGPGSGPARCAARSRRRCPPADIGLPSSPMRSSSVAEDLPSSSRRARTQSGRRPGERAEATIGGVKRAPSSLVQHTARAGAGSDARRRACADLETGQHAHDAVVLAAGDLRVEMAADRHRRQVVVRPGRRAKMCRPGRTVTVQPASVHQVTKTSRISLSASVRARRRSPRPCPADLARAHDGAPGPAGVDRDRRAASSWAPMPQLGCFGLGARAGRQSGRELRRSVDRPRLSARRGALARRQRAPPEPGAGPGLGARDIDASRRSVWRYAKALRVDAQHAVSMGEGWTPLVPGDWDGAPVVFKLEFMMPTGSFKDRGMTVMVSYLKSRGVDHVLEDSSGNAGASLSAYAAAAGMQCRILVPETASYPKIAQIAACGADVVTIKGSRQDVAEAALRQSAEIFYASHNWQPFFVEGTKTLAYELWEQLGFRAPDNVVVPLGYGATCSAATAASPSCCATARSPEASAVRRAGGELRALSRRVPGRSRASRADADRADHRGGHRVREADARRPRCSRRARQRRGDRGGRGGRDRRRAARAGRQGLLRRAHLGGRRGRPDPAPAERRHPAAGDAPRWC